MPQNMVVAVKFQRPVVFETFATCTTCEEFPGGAPIFTTCVLMFLRKNSLSVTLWYIRWEASVMKDHMDAQGFAAVEFLVTY